MLLLLLLLVLLVLCLLLLRLLMDPRLSLSLGLHLPYLTGSITVRVGSGAKLVRAAVAGNRGSQRACSGGRRWAKGRLTIRCVSFEPIESREHTNYRLHRERAEQTDA